MQSSNYTHTILKRIRAKRRGWLFSPKDFVDIAPRNTIDQILFRLVKKGVIRKLSRGIYDFPVTHHIIGMITPTPDKLADILSKKTGDVIQPNGAKAANQLGLDTQVPIKAWYLTSGQTKQKVIAGYTIKFKHSKMVSQFGSNPRLCQLLLALQHLGKDHIDQTVLNKCANYLSHKDKSQLEKSLTKLPQWMAPYILKLIGNRREKISRS